MKKLHARELSRNQSILRFDVILQHDWPIEQCLLHIRVFFGGKTKSPCFDLFIHWLIKQIMNTYRNHFPKSYENRFNKGPVYMKKSFSGYTGHPSYPGRANFSYFYLQNVANPLQEKQKVDRGAPFCDCRVNLLAVQLFSITNLTRTAGQGETIGTLRSGALKTKTPKTP